MTSEDELKEAAVGIVLLTDIPNIVDNVERWYAIEKPARKLADAYLARLAAADEQREREDAEPITEGWALQNGGGRDDGGGIAWKIWERGQDESTEEPAFHVLWSDSLWLECYSATGDTLGIIELMTPPTRGGLRKLLESLKGAT